MAPKVIIFHDACDVILTSQMAIREDCWSRPQSLMSVSGSEMWDSNVSSC